MTLLYCLCAKGRYMHTIWSESMLSHAFCHIQLFEKGCRKKIMCMRQSRKVIWDMIDTLFLATVAIEPTFVAFR